MTALKAFEVAVDLLDSGLAGRKVGNNKGGTLHNIIYSLIYILGNGCARNIGNLGKFRGYKTLALALFGDVLGRAAAENEGFKQGVGCKAVGACLLYTSRCV